jgi:hypothetical protein
VSSNSANEESEKEEIEYDPARGIGVASSSEESDEDTDEDIEIEDETTAAVIIEEEIPKGAPTSRLAAVNLDWDNIHAVDILAVLQSFIPTASDEVVRKVTIYPSEFGKERLQKEAIQGPALFEREEDGPSSKEDGEIDPTVLRRYQLERLRYYYAIIECSSISIAQHLYKNLDGTEIGSTANLFDLRFVPDDVTFDDTPKEQVTSVPDNHQPADFVTEALQHSKPKLTWEGEDPERKRLISEAFKADADTGKWEELIGSSDEEENEGEDMREKYRRLLLGSDEGEVPKNDSNGMQVTFPNSEDEAQIDEKASEEETTLEKYKRKERERKERKRTEKLARKETEKPADLGFDDPFFQSESSAAQKRKEKEAKRLAKQSAEAERAQKADELELLMHDEGDISANHFNINHILKAQKQIKHKKKKRRDAEKELELQEDFQIDVHDPRFEDVYRGGEFALDPNNAAFRKGLPGMQAILEENRRRKRDGEGVRPDRTDKQKRKKRRV